MLPAEFGALFAGQYGWGAGLLLGLMIGSFLNVVIHRLPIMLQREFQAECAWFQGQPPVEQGRYDLLTPASACPHCQTPIRWYQNFPVLSWMALRGRCAHCHAAISFRYPLVETLSGLLFAAAVWQWGGTAVTLWAWGLLAGLVALAFIDLDTQLLPDKLTLPLLWLGLIANLGAAFCSLQDAVIGAVAGYLSLWSVYHLFRLLTGKEGMGYGDFKLLAALGAWLGWKMLLPIVLIASLAGALFGGALLALNVLQRSQPIPFGPWLVLGGMAALFKGEVLLQLWLG